jgi:3-phosphoshikimate 1-carboxyvinyltransferase
VDSLQLEQLSHAQGVVTLPGSKSISNRTLLLAALSQGSTQVDELLDADDTRVMLQALQQLGVKIVRLGPKSVRIDGCGGVFPVTEADLFLGNAGTAFRPLTAALVASAAVNRGHYQLRGVARMHERPIGDLVDGLRQLQADIRYLGQAGYPPLEIRPASLKTGTLQVRGDTSSQFLTALLMMAPLVVQAQAESSALVIEVVGELISKPYIEITLNLMQRFGVQVQRQGWERFTIPAGARYQSPGQITVEGDASSASYFLAAGAIAGGPVRIQGAGARSIQGDVRFAEALALMGAKVVWGDDWIEASNQGTLQAIDLDCNAIPDAAMTLAMCALYAHGTTTLRHIASWRVKETDRLSAMATELRKLGASVEEGADYLRITPPMQWRSASIATYDDHRMAMCFSLAAFATPLEIQDPGCVAKTFPDYFDVFRTITTSGHA